MVSLESGRSKVLAISALEGVLEASERKIEWIWREKWQKYDLMEKSRGEIRENREK